MRSISAKLAIGPLSEEIVEATFGYSQTENIQLMLIASKNQIDHSGGYVNNWTTSDYSKSLNRLQAKYPNSDVIICRDHCGPKFNGVDDVSDSYKTVESDIDSGFHLIHFDFCHWPKEERYTQTKNLIEHALKLNPDLIIEIGTDENTGRTCLCEDDLRKDIQFFTSFCKPHFYVVQTGSLVKEIDQAGCFDTEMVRAASEVIHSFGLKLKEHNADYLSAEKIQMRKGLVDAFNIAPQLGVIQTMYTLTQAKMFGVNVNDFLERSYNSKKWTKWFDRKIDDKFLCAISCGHYNFMSKEYCDLYEDITKVFDLRAGIIAEISKVIDHYRKNS